MTLTDGSGGAKRRILVVEDEFLIAEDTAEMLLSLGYCVVGPVPTIAEALVAIADGPLDAVLLDANLGGASSAPIAAELTARGIPFIVVTGYGNLGLVDAALQAAPRVGKPVMTKTLAEILAKATAQ